MNICICKAIDCPFYNDRNQGYGCQRYAVSGHCHLLVKFYGLENNQYVLSGKKTEEEIALIKSANDDYFVDNEYYKDKIEFQESHLDWFHEDAFKVKKIIVEK
jgi:hypothetical protein